MANHNADIVIFGAGIAGLWVFNQLKSAGYDVLLLESNAIGSGQTIASQGIIHSGLKYAFGGKINKLAQSISAMPDRWREALNGQGPVDLSDAKVSASSQHLLIPKGFMGRLVKLVTEKALGGNVHEISQNEWPEDIRNTGFTGTVVHMDEPVLDVPSVIRALAEPYKDSIRKGDHRADIKARKYIYTTATGNLEIARQLGHDAGLEAQCRPLLMGMMKNAPCELYAHLVGASDKPVVTITTHKTQDGALVWYLGGSVSERAKDTDPQDVYTATKASLGKYMPSLNLSNVEWATLPIDRSEGKSNTDGWMPDTPTIHATGDALYCWPTKLTFAPLLADMIMKRVKKDVEPSGTQTDWSFLSEASYSETPWDTAQWTKDSSDKAA